MTAGYNENDKYVAQWLRNLSEGSHIAPGVVDDRSINDLRPADVADFTQYHFFAGIGVWSYALRRAGWPDDRPVWTGSCPCQPFSAAGKRGGAADDRHLWPAWFRLIRECRPGTILGEQVASKDALEWLDLVHADLESEGYAFAAVDLGAASVGAPHWRQRLWWVAHATRERFDGGGTGVPNGCTEPSDDCCNGGVANADGGYAGTEGIQRGGEHGQQPADSGACGMEHAEDNHGRLSDRQDGRTHSESVGAVEARRMEHAASIGHGANGLEPVTGRREYPARPTNGAPSGLDDGGRPGPVNGFWRDADWLFCTDGKWRPVEPGTFPLAHGVAGRVGQLRAYGNSISPQVAEAFIRAAMSTIDATEV